MRMEKYIFIDENGQVETGGDNQEVVILDDGQ